ncbi:MAG: hypothetical protein KatS3mg009_0003 [Acidimicrobiia bacterium]|nr:MAG: hypothetical protein KatS3mg009_0003 [Acidimicrobiia bacterium]
MIRRLALVTALLVAASSTVSDAGAQENLPKVLGAGSTWSQNAVEQWRADVARFGLRVDYSGGGSTLGRTFFAENRVDFGVSEIPYSPGDQYQASDDASCGKGGQRVNGRCFVYLPIVAGGTAVMYNVRDAAGNEVRNLRLSPATIAKIFTGTIWRWSDPAITADNGGRQLPDRQINVVYRSDGSGTTAQFTAWLAKAPGAREVWNAWASCRSTAPVTSTFPGQQFLQNFPCDPPGRAVAAQGAAGSDGVANVVDNEATGPFSITYVETSYALERDRPVVAVRNTSGAYVLPTARNVAKALERARINGNNRTQVLDDVYVHPDPIAYPISSYSYMIAPTNGVDPKKGEAIARFIHYFVCAGQASAPALGYSPLPRVLVELSIDAAAQIPGAPAPPRVDPSTCRNPTLGDPAFSGPRVEPGRATSGLGGGGGRRDVGGRFGFRRLRFLGFPGGTTAGEDPAAGDVAGSGDLDDAYAGAEGDAAGGLRASEIAAIDQELGRLDEGQGLFFTLVAVAVVVVALAPAFAVRRRDRAREREADRGG